VDLIPQLVILTLHLIQATAGKLFTKGGQSLLSDQRLQKEEILEGASVMIKIMTTCRIVTPDTSNKS